MDTARMPPNVVLMTDSLHTVAHSQRRTLYSLNDIFKALGSSVKFEEMLDHILAVTLRELEADQGSLLLLEGAEHPSLKMLASRGLPDEIAGRGYVPRKGSISEYVIRERRPLILNEM